jgi:hypothetical protein
MPIIDLIRELNAAQKFKIQDKFEFVGFDDISASHIREEKNVPETLEIWAAVKVHYDGELPGSYRSLNFIIGDWVEKHTDQLTENLYEELHKHFSNNYEGDFSDLKKSQESPIWEDQLDFMPRIEQNDNSMIVEIELVLNAEPFGE